MDARQGILQRPQRDALALGLCRGALANLGRAQ